ncbi:MAG: patatin-like phospholipase family protein, partial [Lachnospiraceae bacterium]|nr:patatin-like phospholipase family protein [Lachnospiraceae bacterium]
MIEAGLILEGGGMRGLYTAGVLDFFMEKELEFSSCYGVSAGACHLTSYMSKQKGRAFNIST